MVVVKFGKSLFKILGVLICLGLMFKFPQTVAQGITEGLGICFSVILPSLFPFMVLSCYIVKSHIFSFAYKLFTPVARVIFRHPACAVPVIILSMIGGFPIGIKIVSNLLSEGEITENQAKRLCIFCMNGGPAFIITAVGVNMLGSSRAGVIMYASLCISSLILGVIASFFGDKNEVKKTEYVVGGNLVSLSSALSDALQSVLGICAWVVIFSGLTACLKEFINNESVFISLSAFSEVTKGCILLSGKMPVPVITAVIGFGGICVHCQVLSDIRKCSLKYSHFFVCRILNGAIASVISYLLLLAFPVDLEVFASGDVLSVNTFSVSFPAFFTFAIMCIIMIFDIDRKRKV